MSKPKYDDCIGGLDRITLLNQFRYVIRDEHKILQQRYELYEEMWDYVVEEGWVDIPVEVE